MIYPNRSHVPPPNYVIRTAARPAPSPEYAVGNKPDSQRHAPVWEARQLGTGCWKPEDSQARTPLGQVALDMRVRHPVVKLDRLYLRRVSTPSPASPQVRRLLGRNRLERQQIVTARMRRRIMSTGRPLPPASLVGITSPTMRMISPPKVAYAATHGRGLSCHHDQRPMTASSSLGETVVQISCDLLQPLLHPAPCPRRIISI